jgi:hypothetical protein
MWVLRLTVSITNDTALMGAVGLSGSISAASLIGTIAGLRPLVYLAGIKTEQARHVRIAPLS